MQNVMLSDKMYSVLKEAKKVRMNAGRSYSDIIDTWFKVFVEMTRHEDIRHVAKREAMKRFFYELEEMSLIPEDTSGITRAKIMRVITFAIDENWVMIENEIKPSGDSDE